MTLNSRIFYTFPTLLLLDSMLTYLMPQQINSENLELGEK